MSFPRRIVVAALGVAVSTLLCMFTDCGGSTVTTVVDAGGPCRAESFPDVSRCIPHWVPITGDFATCGIVSTGGGFYTVTTDACVVLCGNPYVSVCGYRDGAVYCQSANCENLDTGVAE